MKSLTAGPNSTLKKGISCPNIGEGVSHPPGRLCSRLKCTSQCDMYVPMLAGAAFGKVFTESGYRALVGKAGRERPEQIEQVLNFEDAYSRVPHTNVYPVLGRYDRYIDFDTQKRCYGDQPILVLDKGHVGAALSPRVLRQHIISSLS